MGYLEEGNPAVLEYLLKKKKAQEDLETRNSGLAEANLFSNIGDVIAGKSVGSGNSVFEKIRDRNKADTVGAFEESNKQDKELYAMDRQLKADKASDEAAAKDKDPAGLKAKMYQALYKKMGIPVPEGLSGSELKEASDIASKMYGIDQAKSERQASAAKSSQEKIDKAQKEREEKEYKLKTPYGLANTEDDAKQLKTADEMKKEFDASLQEMIDLRASASPADKLFDRDAVGRGKQLADKLLLLYKDLSKLGVMSSTDEKILRSIIPSDPLEYNSPIATLQGQDPVLHKMTKFKEDAERDFKNRLNNRLREPAPMSDEDRQALEWANQNPNDPRAEKILQRLKPTAGR